jgi:pectinesterase
VRGLGSDFTRVRINGLEALSTAGYNDSCSTPKPKNGVLANDEIMITAHARTSPEQDRAFVFDHCRVSGDDSAKRVYLGRPWRDYAAVVFMNTQVDAELDPQGWREWTPGKTERLKSAYYAEFNTRGRNSEPSKRQPFTRALSPDEVRRWSSDTFLAGSDGWSPASP